MFIKSTGASGYVKIIAPLPGSDTRELPRLLIAVTRTYTLDPHGKRYGDNLSADIVTLQVR